MSGVNESHSPESCVWGELMDGSPFYWCSLNNTPCRYVTRCNYEEKYTNKEDVNNDINECENRR